MRAFEYGINAGSIKATQVKKLVDEALVKILSDEGYFKKISLSKMKPPRLDKRYDTCYLFFAKYYGFYVKVYSNKDNAGKIKFQNSDAT